MRPTCWTWSARKSASLAVGTAVAGVNRVRARNSNACRETFILRAHLMPDYGGHLTGRYTPLSLISACNCKRHSSNAAPEDAGTPGACQGGSPLSLYSAGSLIVIGFAPETVVSLKLFSAAFRWFSSTASGTPARRNGLRMGIVIKVRAQC
jgi:hypothetical protein